MARTHAGLKGDSAVKLGFGAKLLLAADTLRREVRDDTATRVSAKPQPRSHLADLLRSERQLLANPPFNDSDWFRKDDDGRWQFGVPPKGNANFAWVQHFIHYLAPATGAKSKRIA